MPKEQLGSSAYETLQKDFEQKRNIFEQFVSDGTVAFTEEDKRFTPNKEVYSSDWSIQAGQTVSRVQPPSVLQAKKTLVQSPTPSSTLDNRSNLEDKVLIYKDLTSDQFSSTSSSTPVPVNSSIKPASSSSTEAPVLKTKEQFFPGERNAEGGFRPIVRRPLDGQLRN